MRHKDKVKITIMFRGREVTHPERGVMILDRLAEELSELGVVEQRPTQDGRNMTMMLGPSKAVLAGKVDSDDAAHAPVASDDAVHVPASEAASEAPSNGAVSSPEAPAAQSEESDEALVEVPSDAAAAEIQGGAPDGVAPAAESQNGASDGAVS